MGEAAKPVRGRDDGDRVLWEIEDVSGDASRLVSGILDGHDWGRMGDGAYGIGERVSEFIWRWE